jgi:hypothetical protein
LKQSWDREDRQKGRAGSQGRAREGRQARRPSTAPLSLALRERLGNEGCANGVRHPPSSGVHRLTAQGLADQVVTLPRRTKLWIYCDQAAGVGDTPYVEVAIH